MYTSRPFFSELCVRALRSRVFPFYSAPRNDTLSPILRLGTVLHETALLTYPMYTPRNYTLSNTPPTDSTPCARALLPSAYIRTPHIHAITPVSASAPRTHLRTPMPPKLRITSHTPHTVRLRAARITTSVPDACARHCGCVRRRRKSLCCTALRTRRTSSAYSP